MKKGLISYHHKTVPCNDKNSINGGYLSLFPIVFSMVIFGNRKQRKSDKDKLQLL